MVFQSVWNPRPAIGVALGPVPVRHLVLWSMLNGLLDKQLHIREFLIGWLIGHIGLTTHVWPLFSNSIAFVSKTHGRSLSRKPTQANILGAIIIWGVLYMGCSFVMGVSIDAPRDIRRGFFLFLKAFV